MRNYYEQTKKDVFEYIPLTFHISDAKKDPEYSKFILAYEQRKKEQEEIDEKLNKGQKVKKIHNVWIVKPGENTNRG